MSGNAMLLEAQPRNVSGKKVAKLRRDGLVPAVIYEKGKDSEMIAIPYLPLVKVWNEAGKHQTIHVSYDGKQRLTMIKDITFDPVKGRVAHVAFHAVKQNEAITTEVPIELVGTAPATLAGLIVRNNLDHVEVKGLPGNIPDSIEVDVSAVTTPDDDIRASQLPIPEGITLETDPDTVIVSVVIPRAEVEKPEEEVEAAEVPSEHGAEQAEENQPEK